MSGWLRGVDYHVPLLHLVMNIDWYTSRGSLYAHQATRHQRRQTGNKATADRVNDRSKGTSSQH